MSSILTEIEATVTFVPPPPPIDLLTASQALSASASLYQSDYERQSSHVAIHLANMVNTVVDRLTTFPINLRAFSTNLAQSQAKHFRKVTPTLINKHPTITQFNPPLQPHPTPGRPSLHPHELHSGLRRSAHRSREPRHHKVCP